MKSVDQIQFVLHLAELAAIVVVILWACNHCRHSHRRSEQTIIAPPIVHPGRRVIVHDVKSLALPDPNVVSKGSPRNTAATPKAAESSGGNGRLRVGPSNQPLWQLRGWRRQGGNLIGAYRTNMASYSGEIQLDRRGRAKDFFIKNAPDALVKTGAHSACFRKRPGGKHWIHFNQLPNGNIDAGIVAIERLLHEALSS